MPPRRAAAKAAVAKAESEEEEEEEDNEQAAPARAPKGKKSSQAAPSSSAAATAPAQPEAPEGQEAAVQAPAQQAPLTVGAEWRPHDACPAMTGAEEVEYCPTCGLPPDFCQFGPSWEKCKPWCMEHCPHFYPELSGASLEDAKKSAEAAAEKAKEKMLPGGKKKREKSPQVTIKKLARGGRKCVTSVAGLDGFGLKLDDVAKLFKKQFACGCSVVKGEAGAPDTVDIQGDFEDEVVDIIEEQFKEVPSEKVILLEGGTKKKGKPKG